MNKKSAAVARLEFVARMLSWAPSVPDDDYERICRTWLQITGADWVWLWLLDDNPQDDLNEGPFMQLVAVEPAYPKWTPSKLRNPNQRSVAAKSVRTGEAIIVPDLNAYIDISGESEICFREQLKEMGCKAFVAVPLKGLGDEMTANEGDSIVREFKGVICLHYREAEAISELTHSDYRLMGAFTARTVVNSYFAHQRTILLALERLQHRFLTESSKKPVENRALYLAHLIEVIQKHLRVKGVTIFYHDAVTGDAVCIASTGVAWLKEGQFSEIPNGSLGLLRYPSGKGRTGRCLSSSEPRMLIDGIEGDDAETTSIDLIDGKVDKHVPAIIYPIPRNLDASGNITKGPALGVIRCNYHYSKYFGKRAVFFSPIEVETMYFIARQIAAVLETMAVHIARETTISVTKHDLDNPIRMIWDKVANLRVDQDSEGQDWMRVKRYDILDIGMCGLLASKLVRQLDAFPGEIREYEPTLTNIGSQIIAPVKNMLAHFAKESRNMRIRFDGFDFNPESKNRGFPELYVDRTLISRVVINLLINAIKYGKAETEILVYAHTQGPTYCIDVSNFGLGITKEEEKYIFTPGYRSPRARAVGTGLGLFIAREALKRHGAKISLITGANPTVFRILFPDSLRLHKHD